MKFQRKIALILLFIASFASVPADSQETYLLNYDDVDIRLVTQDIARFAKKTIILDPMLATGNSANAAISIIKKHEATDIVFTSILAAPEGVKAIEQRHPDVQIYTCCLDERLNDSGYITPGLGDAGDRLYGTS